MKKLYEEKRKTELTAKDQDKELKELIMKKIKQDKEKNYDSVYQYYLLGKSFDELYPIFKKGFAFSSKSSTSKEDEP